LIGLSIILWNIHNRLTIDFDVEELLNLAFRVTLDPSFAQPEWGVVLMGILLARYRDRFPSDSRAEIVEQCRKLLRVLEDHSMVANVVRRAASTLCEVMNVDFVDGLDPVVECCLCKLPDTSRISSMPPERLNELIDVMNGCIPTLLNNRERRIYRLYLERKVRGEPSRVYLCVKIL
jgi:hypothetical protein